jgi:hypothetical protein
LKSLKGRTRRARFVAIRPGWQRLGRGFPEYQKKSMGIPARRGPAHLASHLIFEIVNTFPSFFPEYWESGISFDSRLVIFKPLE